ncbi:MAG: hypothetical protein KAS74_00105 [Methanosarcinales archaeon]|nr:hypothetical protein [Methanosarcinales archaeon]
MSDITKIMEIKMREGRERGAATERLYLEKRRMWSERDDALEVHNEEIEQLIVRTRGDELDHEALKQTREGLEQLITRKNKDIEQYDLKIAKITQEIEKIEMKLRSSGQPRTYSVESIR